MNFFKKLFSKNTTPSMKDTPRVESIAMQAKDIPDVEPIVVQAVQYLFPDNDIQKNAFKCILEFKKDRSNTSTLITILALLKYSNGDLELLRKSAWQSHPHFWMDEISHIFRTMEDAEKWVKSLSETQK